MAMNSNSSPLDYDHDMPDEDVCPECGAADPFKPTKEDCMSCARAQADMIEVAERAIGGWDPNP